MKFGIVTPTFQGARFLRETIESVLSQEGDFSIHYHIQDGGSTDGSFAIFKEYEAKVKRGEYSGCQKTLEFTWHSENDSGMYDAINRGFKRMDCDFYAWINSDDTYTAGAFNHIANVFQVFPKIEWLKGVTDYIDEDSKLLVAGRCYLYEKEWILKGIYGNESYFLEQDSMFWRKSLWSRAGPIDSSLKLAGDFYLWFKFAQSSELYSLNERVSSFRKVAGQLSQDLPKYRSEMNDILGGEREAFPAIKFFFKILRRLPFQVGQTIFSSFRPGILPLLERDASGVFTLRRVKGFARLPIQR